MRKFLIGSAILLVMSACAPAPAPQEGDISGAVGDDSPAALVEVAPSITGTIPAGAYAIDPTHTSVTFEVGHLGFSNYTAGFDRVDATLQLDPVDISKSTLEARIELASLDLPSPPEGFHAELLSAGWLNAVTHPVATFQSTEVISTGRYSARVTGDFTLNGVTAPVSLDVVFNGGWEGIPPDPHARVGFSAHGVLKRSDFGVAQGIPAPGTTMGVADAVAFQVETEFTGPEWAEAPPSP